MRIKLTAETKNEKIVLKYLEETATDALCEKINTCGKTMMQCWAYITSEARKEAKNGCACIEDSKVFGWAMHFFEEDSINAEPSSTRIKEESEREDEVVSVSDSKAEKTKKSEKKSKNDFSDLQMSLF